MNANNKRIRVENWLTKNRKYVRIRAIDNDLELKGAIRHFLQDGRKMNDKRIDKSYNFIRKLTTFRIDKDFKRESVEHWLKKNEKYITRSTFDNELVIEKSVRHFLYTGRTINNERIKLLFSLIKRISQF